MYKMFDESIRSSIMKSRRLRDSSPESDWGLQGEDG